VKLPSYRYIKYGIIIENVSNENVSNEVGSMKKFIAGFIVGLCIGLPISTMADSMIGKRIETEVPIKLDGEYLPINAIGLEGRTYAPVRALAEALGKEVDWDGEVIIKTSVTAGGEQMENKPEVDTAEKKAMLEREIARYTGLIETYQRTIQFSKEIGASAESIAQLEKDIEYWQGQLDRYTKELAELEKSE